LGAATLKEARDYLNKDEADVVLLDVRLPDGYGPNLLQESTSMLVRPP